MGIKFTESELIQLMNKNKNLKISGSVGGKNPTVDNVIEEQNKKIELKSEKQKSKKLTISENKEDKKTKSKGVTVSEINKLNKNSTIEITSSKEHLSIVFNGAKLLSVNQIFSILQYRKYEIFTYKKIWHEIIKNILDEENNKLLKEGKTLPFFEDAVEVTLFRQASRLVDEDAMSTMFKYIIDGLKRDEDNTNGILAEDNPKIVHRIVCYSEKGTPVVGIKVKKIINKKEKFEASDILKM